MERHRLVIAFAIAVAPVAGMIGFGCSSDDETPSVGMIALDPGGTFGAEVSIRVVGRGRITGSIPAGIDCPTNCYVRYTFKTPTDRGAAEGLTLKATATPGAKFVGWTFENEQLGTRSKGPDNCNPVKRASSQPGDSNAGEIKLAFGETNGSPPSGQEGACTGDYVKVPVAYKLLARFEDIPEAAPLDAGDDGDGGDGGTGDLVFNPAQVALGAVATKIGIASGYVYWKTENGSNHAISYGFPSSTPTTGTQIVNPGTSISQFEVDSNYVLYQVASSSMFAISGGGTSPTTMTGSSTLNCVGLASDGISNHYCRTATGDINGWTTGGTGPTLSQSGAPTGADLALDTSYFFIPDLASSSANIYYVLRSTVSDAGPAGWNTLVSNRSYVHTLRLNTSHLFWLEYNVGTDVGQVYANSSKFSSTAYQMHPSTSGLRHIALDPSNSSIAYIATTTQILRSTYLAGGTAGVPFRTGLTGVGGIAVDNTYVYWTQSDGRVYRALKN